jgi:hypothetical protein
MIGGLWPMKRYLEERLRLARAQGGEGLIAELVRVEMEGGRISANEMVSMVFLLLGAGSACRRCSHAGHACGWRSIPPISAGASGPDCGRSKSSRYRPGFERSRRGGRREPVRHSFKSRPYRPLDESYCNYTFYV